MGVIGNSPVTIERGRLSESLIEIGSSETWSLKGVWGRPLGPLLDAFGINLPALGSWSLLRTR
jgi:hypothetical protein